MKHVGLIKKIETMGQKMFATLIVAVVAMFAGYNVYQSQNIVVLSELALANVEALADFEWDQDGWYCWTYSYEDYSSDAFFTYIRCFDCNISSAISVSGPSQCWH